MVDLKLWSTPGVIENNQPSSPPAANKGPALPVARHLSRIPPAIGPEQLLRIRQAAYQLPQVSTPADFGDGKDQEDQLDKQGLILLQKAVAGARPSRWIAPELMGVALAHLDVVGSAPGVRALMQQRTAQLEAAGLTRSGSAGSACAAKH